MKKRIATYKTQKKSKNELILKTILKPEIIVQSGISELDNLVGGFKAGEINLIDGDSPIISTIPNKICVNTYRTFKSSIIYLDGGMCANPYKIAYYAKLMESDQKEILENVHLSRAFTVYQLTTLIQHMLENSIRRYHPQTLIVGNLPVLFFDPDITTREARVLLKNNLDKLKELTVRYNLITVFTSLDKKMMLGTRNLRKTLYSGVDEIIKLKQREKRIDVNIVKKQIKTTILCFSKGQLRLQDFGMVIQ